MKKQSLLLAAAGLAFTLSACDKKAADAVHKPADGGTPVSTESVPARTVPKVDPKVAFQDGLNALAVEIAAITKEAKDSGNPLMMLQKLPPILEKAKAVPTTGLSEELSTAYDGFLKSNDAVLEVLKVIPSDLPTKQEEMAAYMQAHPEAAKAFMDMQPKLQEASQKADEAKNNLKAAAEKEGIDINKFLTAGD